MLKDKWSSLTGDRIWLRGKKYSTLSIARLIEVVGECSVKSEYYWIDEGWECESFSTMLQSKVLDYQYDEEIRESNHPVIKFDPWFFAIAIGLKFKGVDGNHNVNICIVDEGIAFIEPQTDDIWLADSRQDYPYFIFR